MRKLVNIFVLAVLMTGILLPSLACQQGGGDIGYSAIQLWNKAREWFIMKGADDRIEKIRKNDCTITVVDEMGVPVRDARIYYEQKNHQFLFGSEMSPLAEKGPNAVNQDWAEAYATLFNYGTLPVYWSSYEANQGQTWESLLLSMADWAGKRGIATCGHPLIWSGSVPAWAPLNANDMQKVLEKRVSQTVGNSCGKINYWDVVNEPTTSLSYSNPVGNWISARTPAVACADAMVWARAACPTATLIINDYRTDDDYRKLLQDMLRQKVRFDAVGIQSQMYRGNWPLYQVWDICDRFSDLGVPIHFTQVAVLSGAPLTGIGNEVPQNWPSTPEGEKLQAEYATEFYTLLFSHPSVEAITWWEFSDLDAAKGAPTGLIRDDMTKKPAYTELLKLVHGKWWSSGNVSTNNDGKVTIRGFCGDYKLVVEKEGVGIEQNISIVKGLDNKINVQMNGYKQPPPTPLWEQVWPYLVALAVIGIIILIIREMDKASRRI